MVFVDSPTEQTTALTDLLLCLTCWSLAVVVFRAGHLRDGGRSVYWKWLLLLLGFAAGTGAVAHGVEMSEELNRLVWMPLNLALGLTVSFFLVIVVLELRGPKTAKRALPYLIGTGVAFFLITVIIPGMFLLFIIYEGMVMLFAFGAFIYLLRTRGGRHYRIYVGIISAGVLISILAAVAQMIDPLKVTLILEFDENSFFHVLQIVAMFVLTYGVVGQIRSLR